MGYKKCPTKVKERFVDFFPWAARKARNPRTGDEVSVKEKNVVVFKSGKALENALRKKNEKQGKVGKRKIAK